MNQMTDGINASNTMEILQNSLGHVKMLRCSMNNVFEFITINLENSASSSASSSGSGNENFTTEEKERHFKIELNSNMQRVIANVRELEKLVMSLQAPMGPFSLGNTSLINQEVSADKIPLYSQLIDSYKWLEKVHDYAGLAIPLLGQNPLKRTYFGASLSAKRRKTMTTSAFNVQNNAIIDNTIMSINASYKDMEIKLVRPLGLNSVLCITLGRTLRAIVILKGWLIEWVMIRGLNEEMNTENGELDLWTESRHKIFQKVTDNANAAMLHFHVPIHPELSVRSYLTWFHSYITLFSQPCKKCGLHLANNMPPTWRDLRSLEPFHEECHVHIGRSR